MKFQKLTIHNIASIEDAVIDFESYPLADSEVFLITGKTGAGKSTILDAICLALFATTPRMDNTNMQGDTSDGTETLKIKDPRQLMRRNTGEAFVSLLFTGSNGVHYEAVWSVARARGKVTGRIQKKSWQLKNLDTLDLLDKDNDIKTELSAAIGLDFNQFCRTTMLAQGEFTRFLNSKDDDKAEILEKITGVDVYSKIGAKVFEVATNKEQVWRNAQHLIEGVITLTDAQIAEKRKEMEDYDNQYETIKAASGKETVRRDWLKTNAELIKKMNDAVAAHQLAKETLESDGFTKENNLVNEWNATIEARSWMTEKNKAEATKTSQQKVLDELSGNFATILGGQQFDIEEMSQIEAEIKEINAYLSAEVDKASVYDKAQTIEALLTAIYLGREFIEKKDAGIAKERKTLAETLSPALEKSKQDVDSAKEALGKDEANIKSKEDEISTLDLANVRTQRDSAKDLLGKITLAKERIETLTAAETKYEETRKNLEGRKLDIAGKRAKSTAMDGPIHDAEIKMNIRKEDLDNQRDTVDKFATQLRQKLKVGDTCPVCRQKIETELPHEEELTTLVGGLQKAYDDAAKEHKDMVEAKVKLDAEIITETDAYDRDFKAFENDKSVEVAKKKALDACGDCGIEILDDKTILKLKTLEDTTNESLKGLNTKIQDGEKKENELRELRKALDAKRKEVDSLSTKMKNAEKAVDDCNVRIANAETLRDSKKTEVKTSEDNVVNLITGVDWEMDWKEKPKEFAEALSAASKRYSDNEKKKRELAGKLEQAKTAVENVQGVIKNILSAMPGWKNVKPSSVAKVKNLLSEANNLNADVAKSLSLLKTAEESIEANKSKLEGFLSEHPLLEETKLLTLNVLTATEIQKKTEALEKFRNDEVAKKTLMDNAQAMLIQHQDKKPELAEDETLDALEQKIANFDIQMKEIVEKKGAVVKELTIDRDNKTRLASLMEDSDKKKAEYQKWARMNKLIGDANGTKFRKIAQSYVLASLIHSANSYMRTLTDRYILKITPGTFVISLEDAYQGYISRAASTISGGESFLVSLSLALALSDIGQTLSVDTLFIDEGFGSLSGEPLNNAINTLRSLHTKAGRHVGIISHVEELRERIPVQIQVNQEANNSSSKITVVPN